MKIAVPLTKENLIEAHVGKSEFYGVFTISENTITGMKSIEAGQGCGCSSDIASVLASDGVTVVLAAGIGGGATSSFNKHGIKVIRGLSGDAAENVKLYLSGSAEDKGSSCDKHSSKHDHDHGHIHVHELSLAHNHDHNQKSNGHSCGGGSCGCN